MKEPQSFEDSTGCLLCGELVTRAFVKEGSPTFLCRPCGFAQSRHRSNHNFEPIEDPAYIDYFDADEAEQINFQDVYQWMNGFSSRGTILDIGAGSGGWIEYLRNRGEEAYGIEGAKFVYDRWIAGSDRAKWITLSSMEEFTTDGPFDRVTANDVMEHLLDPRIAIAQFARLTKPGGHLFLSTPNLESLPARLFGKRWHYYNRYHFSLFSARAIRHLLQSNGFEVLHFSHRGRLLSLRHLWMYGWNFGMGIDPPWLPRSISGTIRINTFDTMYVVARRRDHKLTRDVPEK